MDDTTVDLLYSAFVPTSGFTPSRDTSSNEASSNSCDESIPTSSLSLSLTPAIFELTQQSSGSSISTFEDLSAISALCSDASFNDQSPIQQPDEGKGSRKRKLDQSGDNKKQRHSRKRQRIYDTWHDAKWIKGRGKSGYKGVGRDGTRRLLKCWRAKCKNVQKRFELRGDTAEWYYRMSIGMESKELS